MDGWKLALVGGIDPNDAYTREVIRIAQQNPNIVLTGFQQGLALHELFAHAGLFVLPSSHEGLPIALLEALSFGLPVVASDIAANKELGLPTENYFSLGDVDELARLILRFTTDVREDKVERAGRLRAWVADRYNWQDFAKQTLTVYRRAMGVRSEPESDLCSQGRDQATMHGRD